MKLYGINMDLLCKYTDKREDEIEWNKCIFIQ